MSVGITQLILLVIIAIILFGNIPRIFKDLSTGILKFKQTLKQSNTLDSKSEENTSVDSKADSKKD